MIPYFSADLAFEFSFEEVIYMNALGQNSSIIFQT